MTEMALVELGGVEYDATPCEACGTSGERRDPTLADSIHSRTHGKIRCPMCDGQGTRYTITARGMAQERAKWAEQKVARVNELNAELARVRQLRRDLGQS